MLLNVYMNKVLIYFIIGLVLFFSGFFVRQCTFTMPAPEIKEYRDTVTVTDTAWFPDPVEVERLVLDTMYVEVPTDNIVVQHDTTYIPLPREYVTYHKDSVYTAIVSGFAPRLEEITVYPKTQYITVQTEKVYTEYKHYKFGVGIQAGYGITPAGFQPYLGLGLSYNLIGF